MHLRPTTPADIPRCASIVDAAYQSDELYNFLAPDRAKYPLSWRQLCLKIHRDNFYKPNVWCFVCVADASDASFAREGEILGSARWTRNVSKEDDAAADPWWQPAKGAMERLEGLLRHIELRWEETLRCNPARSWARRDIFMRFAAKSTCLAPLKPTTHWYLDGLTVAPEFQRRGVATMLASWGVDRAREETVERVARGKPPVPVTLIASAPGLGLYRSLGFKVVAWEDGSFLDGPVAGGGNLVWDPTGYWIQDVEFDQPMRRGVVEAVYRKKDEGKDSETP